MGEDIGLIIGTAIFMVFGLAIAYGLPKVIIGGDKEPDADTLRFTKWLKWLGLTLVFMSIVAVIAFIVLP
jgi:hypothetical protein